jgi:hypothetical protein
MYSDAAARIAALRRVSGAEIVDEGIQLARQNYGVLILAGLVPLLPNLGTNIWTASHGNPDGPWSMLLYTAAWAFWASLTDAATARAAMDVLEGRSPDPARALGVALRRAWPVAVSGLYRMIFWLAGLVLVLVPGFYVLSVYALIPVLPVLEPDIGGWQALRRSAMLTKGARRLSFGTYVLPYAFAVGASIVMSALMEGVVGPHFGRLFGGLLGSVVDLAFTPFMAAIQVRLYVELRMRKEAIDIEWALASPSPGTAAFS